MKATTGTEANQLRMHRKLIVKAHSKWSLVGTGNLVIFWHKVGIMWPICFIDDITVTLTTAQEQELKPDYSLQSSEQWNSSKSHCLHNAIEGGDWFMSPSNTGLAGKEPRWHGNMVSSNISFSACGFKNNLRTARPGRRRRDIGSWPSRRIAPRCRPESWSASAPLTSAPGSSDPSRLKTTDQRPPKQHNLRFGIHKLDMGWLRVGVQKCTYRGGSVSGWRGWWAQCAWGDPDHDAGEAILPELAGQHLIQLG